MSVPALPIIAPKKAVLDAVIDVNGLLWNIPAPTVVTEFGILADVIWLPSNAKSSIVCNALPKDTDVNLLDRNAYLPIYVTAFGIVIDVKSLLENA